MPKALEEKLRKMAHKKGYKGDRADKYVYGSLNEMGYMHGNKRTNKSYSAGDQKRAFK